MKVETIKPDFMPVVLTLQTPEDVRFMLEALKYYWWKQDNERELWAEDVIEDINRVVPEELRNLVD